MRRSRRSESGFSLAEVMIAVAVLTIAVLGLVSSQIFALQAGQGNRKRHTASVAAWKILSAVEEQARRDFALSSLRPRQKLARLDLFERSADFDEASLEEYEAQIVEQVRTPDFKRVEVVIHYQDDRGAQSEYKAWTYLYDVSKFGG